jgi:predicted permease
MTKRRGREPERDATDDVAEEVRAHLESRTEALIRRGLDPASARAQAEREFGDIDDARAYMTDMAVRTATARQRRRFMNDFLQDVRYAFRRLRAAPAFTATSLITLAVGIGATTAIFSLVYGIVFRSLPFRDPGQLYRVYSASPASDTTRASVSAVDLDDWRAQRRNVEDLGGLWFQEGSSGVDLTGRGEPRRIPAAFFKPGFFETLGVTPAAGRLPREDEAVRGGPDDIVMLTHRFWLREFNGDAGAVNATLTIGGVPHTVVGVLPASFHYPSDGIDVFIPYSTIPDHAIPRIRPVRTLSVVARAKPGVTEQGVADEMNAIAKHLSEEYPEDRAWGAATVVPLADVVVGPARDGLLVLLGAVALLLLMAAVNVAALQLARASTRGREMAVRLALGAQRSRLARQVLTESLVLALVGGALGVAVAFGALRALLVLAAGQLPRIGEISIDTTTLAFAAAVSVCSSLLFGVAPALRMLRTEPQRALGGGARGAVGADSQRLRSGLVIAEVAVAVVLVVGAGLMTRSFLSLLQVDPGFRPERLVAVQMTIDGERHASPPDPAVPGLRGYMAYYRQVLDRVRQIPGVDAAGAAKNAPFRGNGERNGFRIPGRVVAAGEDGPTASVIHVSDGYFATIGARMVAGREFTPLDRAGAPLVLVVNEAFARQFFPADNTVGQRLTFGSQSAEIVGVVNDIRQVDMAAPPDPTMYISNMQNGRVQMTIVARTQGDRMTVARDIREAIWSIDPLQTITSVFTFDESVSTALAQPRLLLVLMASFGGLGLLLGAVGIYGVLASTVNQRRREIGVRMALGAAPSGVSQMIVRRGMLLTGVGLAIGLAASLALGRSVQSVLFGVRPTDAATLAGVVITLTAAALVASWLPARRAARVDPVRALQE